MILAVDFDGTIVKHQYPDIGVEKKNAIKTLQALQSMGHKIILWTCRTGYYLELAKIWLAERDFIPDAINENIENIIISSPKVYADVYIDDRSFPPFTNWNTIKEYFL